MHLSTQHDYRLSCQYYIVVISPWHTHLKNPIMLLWLSVHRYMWNSLDNKDFSVHFVPTGILLQLTTTSIHSESLPLLWHLGSESRTVKSVSFSEGEHLSAYVYVLWLTNSTTEYSRSTFKMHFLLKFNFCHTYIIFITFSLFNHTTFYLGFLVVLLCKETYFKPAWLHEMGFWWSQV